MNPVIFNVGLLGGGSASASGAVVTYTNDDHGPQLSGRATLLLQPFRTNLYGVPGFRFSVTAELFGMFCTSI